MKMYTHDGQAVEVVKKIEDGYLAKLIYEDYSEDFDEEDDPDYSLGEQIVFFAELFEAPQTFAYALEVKKLKDEAEKIRIDIAVLVAQKANEAGLLNQIAKYPFIAKLVQYVTGDFNFILNLNTYEVSDKKVIYNGPYIRAMNTEGAGWGLYKLSHSGYSSNEDRPFLIFHTMDEVNSFVKTELIEKIGKYRDGFYNSPQNLKEWFSRIHYKQTMKDDPEVLAAFEAKMAELTRIQAKRQADELEKQFQALEAKKKELENLQTAHQ
jgi:hypothetical protein